MPPQSALVVLVPEAEPLVGPFRRRYDTSADDGMPPHITINYPFLPDEEVTPDTIRSLHLLFSTLPSFSFTLGAVKRFPGTLYLEPSPSQPFARLIQLVAQRFPHSPPYGGIFDDVIPHLTVATADGVAARTNSPAINSVNEENVATTAGPGGSTAAKTALDLISRRFADTCVGRLPVHASVRDVWLMDNHTGSWTRRESFPLAAPD